MIRECVIAGTLVYLTIAVVQAGWVRAVTAESAAVAVVCLVLLIVFSRREESHALHIGEAVALIAAVGLIIVYGVTGGGV